MDPLAVKLVGGASFLFLLAKRLYVSVVVIVIRCCSGLRIAVCDALVADEAWHFTVFISLLATLTINMTPMRNSRITLARMMK